MYLCLLLILHGIPLQIFYHYPLLQVRFLHRVADSSRRYGGSDLLQRVGGRRQDEAGGHAELHLHALSSVFQLAGKIFSDFELEMFALAVQNLVGM